MMAVTVTHVYYKSTVTPALVTTPVTPSTIVYVDPPQAADNWQPELVIELGPKGYYEEPPLRLPGDLDCPRPPYIETIGYPRVATPATSHGGVTCLQRQFLPLSRNVHQQPRPPPGSREHLQLCVPVSGSRGNSAAGSFFSGAALHGQ